MRICPDDELVMQRTLRWDADGGPGVEYVCSCGRREAGGPSDVRLAGQVRGRGNVLRRFRHYIDDIAVYDRAVTRVAMNCPDCNLDYLCQIVLGNEQVVFVWRCDCGYDSSKPGAKLPAAMGRPLGGEMGDAAAPPKK